MAFTSYLGQTAIGLFIFYGVGLGYWGTLGLAQLWVLAIQPTHYVTAGNRTLYQSLESNRVNRSIERVPPLNDTVHLFPAVFCVLYYPCKTVYRSSSRINAINKVLTEIFCER